MKIDKNALNKMTKGIEQKFAKESKKHPYTASDSVADIERKLKAQMKAIGAIPDNAAIKKQAKEIHRQLQSGK